MRALVRDLKNDVWQIEEISKIRKCTFFPYRGDTKWWGEAISYDKYKHLNGTMFNMNKAMFITENDLNQNKKRYRRHKIKS